MICVISYNILFFGLNQLLAVTGCNFDIFMATHGYVHGYSWICSWQFSDASKTIFSVAQPVARSGSMAPGPCAEISVLRLFGRPWDDEDQP